eukprot:UN17530
MCRVNKLDKYLHNHLRYRLLLRTHVTSQRLTPLCHRHYVLDRCHHIGHSHNRRNIAHRLHRRHL